MLRRFTGLHTCLVLLLAFVMGPFQHVHQSRDTHHGSGDHDEVSTFIHAHPYGISVADPADDHTRIDDRHGAHAAWSLDTFTILSDTPQFLFVPAESKVLPFVPAESLFAVEVTAIRGHDPPSLEHRSPRAPPV